MSKDTYILQFDIFGMKAKTELIWLNKDKEGNADFYVSKLKVYEGIVIPASIVENNPSFFKLKEQKEWEIVAVRRDGANLNVQSGSEFQYIKGDAILTVKRLSDGEVFTVGKIYSYGKAGIITKFHISPVGEMLCDIDFGYKGSGTGYSNAPLRAIDVIKEEQPPVDKDAFVIGCDPVKGNLEWNENKTAVVFKKDDAGKFTVLYHSRPEKSSFDDEVKKAAALFGNNIMFECCGGFGKHTDECHTLKSTPKEDVGIVASVSDNKIWISVGSLIRENVNIDGVDYFTKKQLLEAEEKAFNAARETDLKNTTWKPHKTIANAMTWDSKKYETFSDYKNKTDK